MVHVHLNIHTGVLGYTRHTGYWVQFMVVIWDIRRPETPLVRCIMLEWPDGCMTSVWTNGCNISMSRWLEACMAEWLERPYARFAEIPIRPNGLNARMAKMPVWDLTNKCNQTVISQFVFVQMHAIFYLQ